LQARFRYIATELAGGQQFMSLVGPLNDNDPALDTIRIPVESGATELLLSLSFDGGCSCAFDLTAPNGSAIAPFQIQSVPGPLDAPFPSDTIYHIVWRVSMPVSGTWTLVVERLGLALSLNSAAVNGAAASPPPYLVQGTVHSDVTLDLHLPVPESERTSGVIMPIVATLTDLAPIPGTAAAVSATVVTPANATYIMVLHDDGAHGDGAANDGVYANSFRHTNPA
jgi:hypothetical protein